MLAIGVYHFECVYAIITSVGVLRSFLCFLLCFPGLLSAQESLQIRLQKLIDSKDLLGASLGAVVLDGAKKEILFSRFPFHPFTPASSFKVVSTAAALQLLGGDFRYTTVLGYRGNLGKEGILEGDLIIIGSGDPVLGSEDMPRVMGTNALRKHWVKQVRDAGIKKITGAVIGDDSIFPAGELAAGWPEEDHGNYYGSGAWGLNIRENYYNLFFSQVTKLGKKPPIHHLEPEVPGLELDNHLKSGSPNSGDQAYIYGAPFNYQRFIKGSIPVGKGLFDVKGSFPDPPLMAAQMLKKSLQQAGIPVEGGAQAGYAWGMPLAKEEMTGLDTIWSPPLKEIVRRANIRSVNLYCEALLKTMGHVIHQDGSMAGGLAALLSFWEDNGLNLTSAYIEDGSGLSPANTISPYQLASVLYTVLQDEEWSTDFLPSIPRAGKDGTMKYILRGSPVAKRIQAKSGSFSGVRSYTGYAHLSNGQKRVFCLMLNNYPNDKDGNRFLVSLMEEIAR